MTDEETGSIVEYENEWWNQEKRVDPGTAYRRKQVAECWNVLGLSVKETADQLGISTATVSRDRRWLLDRWQDSVKAQVNDVVGRELAKLDRQETELWKAWRNSSRNRTKTKRTVIIDDDGQPTQLVSQMTEVTESNPDPRYMDLIIKVQQRRAALLGYDAQAKKEGEKTGFADFIKATFEMAHAKRAAENQIKEVEGKVIEQETEDVNES